MHVRPLCLAIASALVASGAQAIQPPPTITPVLLPGAPAPGTGGTVLAAGQNALVGPDGTIVFRVWLEQGVGGVTAANDRVIYVAGPGGGAPSRKK